MSFTPPRTFPSIDVSMNLLESSYFGNHNDDGDTYEEEQEQIAVPMTLTTTETTTSTGQEWNSMPPPLPRQSETYGDSLSNNNNNNKDNYVLRNTNIHHPSTTSTYRRLPQTTYEEYEEEETATGGGDPRNQQYEYNSRKSGVDTHSPTTNETTNKDRNGLEVDSLPEEEEDMGLVHSLLMKNVSKWIQELQTVRDDMQILSVKNAILLDSLAMAGADV